MGIGIVSGVVINGELFHGEGSSTEGIRFNIGNFVFTRQRHADIVDIPKDIAEKQFVLVSKELAKQATFLELVKVAMHGIHRVNIKPRDWIVVFGLGIVGNLSA